MNCVLKKKENLQEKLFEQILNGNYPSKDVNRMSVNSLENFAFRLLKFTSVKVGAKSKSDTELTNWWPWSSAVLIHKKNRKEFRGNLKKVVINCCEFFKQKWLPPSQPWINDENYDFIQAKAEKRKAKDVLEIYEIKRRKTLLVSDKKKSYEPDINISEYVPEDLVPSNSKPLDQSEFLQLFKLNLNNNEIPKATQVPNNFRIIRLQNCPHVPFSSNVGQHLMKKENSCVPDNVTERKIERIEWYINRESQRTLPNINYEVTYVQNKNYVGHNFRFPKRQYHQMLGDENFNNFVHKICKPLSVVVTNDNLVELKNCYNIKMNNVFKRVKIVIEKKKATKIIKSYLKTKITRHS